MRQIDISLDETEKDLCEGELDLPEITTAMRGLSTGKTPGPDGLPQEFYAKFWNLLGLTYSEFLISVSIKAFCVILCKKMSLDSSLKKGIENS